MGVGGGWTGGYNADSRADIFENRCHSRDFVQLKLPNPERAVLPLEKLRDYCLNPEHTEGGSAKARVFRAALGLEREDAETLRIYLLQGIVNADATLARDDQYGQRYKVIVRVTHGSKTADVTTGWIVCPDEDFARLSTSYIDD
jgi:hypothetical protein